MIIQSNRCRFDEAKSILQTMILRTVRYSSRSWSNFSEPGTVTLVTSILQNIALSFWMTTLNPFTRHHILQGLRRGNREDWIIEKDSTKYNRSSLDWVRDADNTGAKKRNCAPFHWLLRYWSLHIEKFLSHTTWKMYSYLMRSDRYFKTRRKWQLQMSWATHAKS